MLPADRLLEFYSTDVLDTDHNRWITFTVPRRYINLLYLSAGAQGAVVSAYDEINRQHVAIKKMHKPCCNKTAAKYAFRELSLMTSVHHPNIVRLFDAFTPNQSTADFEELYLVMELMDCTLHRFLQERIKEGKRLSHAELSFIIYQLLCAVNHLHKSGIIHRDIKPSNIMLNENFTLKLADFGLARRMSDHKTSYHVVTRHYRAPEIILGIHYDEKADVWSIGCIIAELLLHRIFLPGTCQYDQWTKIVGALGTPSEEFMQRLPKNITTFLRSPLIPYIPQRPMDKIVTDWDFDQRHEVQPNLTADSCRDLLGKMLCIDPRDRYTVEECAAHPYVNVSTWVRDGNRNLPPSVTHYDNAIERQDRALDQWKELIFGEIGRFQRATGRTYIIQGRGDNRQPASWQNRRQGGLIRKTIQKIRTEAKQKKCAKDKGKGKLFLSKSATTSPRSMSPETPTETPAAISF